MIIGIVNILPERMVPPGESLRPKPGTQFDLITEIGILIKSEAGQQLVTEQSP
jgi:hypothetical protein|tara:strand:- start:378 stop:536 length:159 start_codon:yes stop_codon:yes gene_type:complete